MLAAVAGDPAAPVEPAQRVLETLAAYSLVGFSGGAGGQRLRLHPLVRELAHEEWALQSPAAQHAALAGLLAGVSAWVSQWSRDLDLLAHDADLIAGSFRAACRQRVELPTAFAILTAFNGYLLTRDLPLRKALNLLQLETARAVGDRQAELVALGRVRMTANLIGQIDEVMGYTRQTLDVARELRDAEATASMLSFIARDAIDHGDVEEARRLFDEARPLARAFAVQTAAEQAKASNALIFLGQVAAVLGHITEAREWYQQARALAQSAGDDWLFTLAIYHLGDLAARTGEYDTARSYFEQVAAIQRAAHNVYGLGCSLDWLGEIALRTGDLTTAAQCFQEAEQALASIEHAQMLAHVHGNLAALQGEIARARGDTAEAAHYYGEALEFFAQDQGLAPASHITSRAYADWVAERLATLSQPVSASQTGAAPPTSDAVAAVPPTRRRWWPWGRK
jgi:tetratricopeptide (TPR) repeat protein